MAIITTDSTVKRLTSPNTLAYWIIGILVAVALVSFMSIRSDRSIRLPLNEAPLPLETAPPSGP